MYGDEPDEDGVFVANEFLIFFVSNMIQSVAVFSGSWTCVYLFTTLQRLRIDS